MAKLIKQKTEDPFSMNPDCLFFSDLHLSDRKEFSRVDPETGLNTRLLEGLSILDQIGELCDRGAITSIYFLGDIFERKDQISNHLLTEFKRWLSDTVRGRVTFYSLMGNHDFNLPNYPSLEIFKDEHFIFRSKPGPIGNSFYAIPFCRDWGDFKREWKKAHELPITVLLMHQEIPDGVYESGKPITGVWDLKTDPDILYLSGHLHKPQKVHGIQFLGSPYQVKFSDEGQERFIWLYNSKTKQLRPYQLNYSKFVSIDWQYFKNPAEYQQAKEIANGKYIKITGEVLKEGINQEMKKNVKEALEKFGAKAVVFNVKIKRQEAIDIGPSVDDDKEVIIAYAKKNVGGLDIDKLTKTGVEIYAGL